MIEIKEYLRLMLTLILRKVWTSNLPSSAQLVIFNVFCGLRITLVSAVGMFVLFDPRFSWNSVGGPGKGVLPTPALAKSLKTG